MTKDELREIISIIIDTAETPSFTPVDEEGDAMSFQYYPEWVWKLINEIINKIEKL